MKEALKLALEALEDALNKPMWDRPKMTKAIIAIKEALAQPDPLADASKPIERIDVDSRTIEVWPARAGQEPVAKVCHDLAGHIGWNPAAKVNEFPEGMELFATTTPLRSVQEILAAFPLYDDEGLDQDKYHCEWALQQDRKRLHSMLALEALEIFAANYSDGNEAITAVKEALAQPEQEPVEDVVAYHSDGTKTVRIATKRPWGKPWVSLTDEDISQLWISTSPYFNEDDFARNIEAALRSKNT